MDGRNFYDVTKWKTGDPYQDIGAVMNSIIADIKIRQTDSDENEGGKPGAVIYLPVGDYRLATQVVIDISYLKIMGSGHGFTSSSIRFNTPEDELENWHEIWPGGSRILVDLPAASDEEERSGAAFYVKRDGEPRISSVEFENFCIDGLHFVDDGTKKTSGENTYKNGKTGIYVESAQDSFRITGMGFVYLEHGIVIYHADALAIHDNFIAECGSCIELRGWGQASKITDNLMGAGYKGYSIYAQNFGGLLIATNNIFPRGMSSVHFENVMRSTITGNRFHSFYPGMLVLGGKCSDNMIASNHFFRDYEPWKPMLACDNGQDDGYGILNVSGNYNSIMANHISETVKKDDIKPKGTVPVIIHVVSGVGNFISSNHIVAMAETSVKREKEDEGCYSAQVEALLASDSLAPLKVTTVLIEKEARQNTVLDSGSEAEVVMDRTENAFRATPTV